MSAARVAAVVVTVVVASATAAGAQGLAEAAARARQEQQARQAAVQAVPVLPPTENDFTFENPWEITVAGFRQYAAIRSDLKAVRRYWPTLNARLYEASQRVDRLAELASVISSEPSVVDVLDRYHVTPREYLWMEQTFLTDDYWLRRDSPRGLRDQLIHVANIRFLREQARLVRELIPYWGEQWHDADRFIERF
jgi:hypothetical protein